MKAPSDPEEETLETPSDPDENTQEAALDLEEGTMEAPLDSEEETLETPSDPGVESKDVAGLAEGSTDLEGLVVPPRRQLTTSGNFPPNNVNAHMESTGACMRERSNAAKFSADEQGRWRGECVDVRRRVHDDFSENGGATGADSEGHVTGAVNRQKAVNALEMEKYRNVRRKKKWKVAQPNEKLVVGARMMYKRKMKDCEVEKYRYRLTA